MTSLYDRLGGAAAVNAAVDLFYTKVLADDSLAPCFVNTDLQRLAGHQKAFLTMAFGGPANYSGQQLAAAHERMVSEQGLADAHFDAVAGHLQATLEELGVAPADVAEVMAIAGSTRGSVLNRE